MSFDAFTLYRTPDGTVLERPLDGRGPARKALTPGERAQDARYDLDDEMPAWLKKVTGADEDDEDAEDAGGDATPITKGRTMDWSNDTLGATLDKLDRQLN